MSKRVIVLAGLLWALPCSAPFAWADALPRIDPAKVCDRLARLEGPFDQSRFDTCLAKEKQARETIRALGPVVSAEVKRRCQAESTSYDGLVKCVKREGLSILKQFNFKF